MDENFVVVFEFEMSLEDFNYHVESLKKENSDFDNSNIIFPINTLLSDNGIYNRNKFEVASPKDFIGSTISDKSPTTNIIIKILVDKKYEEQALEIINSEIKFEELDELKEYEPIEDDEPIKDDE